MKQRRRQLDETTMLLLALALDMNDPALTTRTLTLLLAMGIKVESEEVARACCLVVDHLAGAYTENMIAKCKHDALRLVDEVEKVQQ